MASTRFAYGVRISAEGVEPGDDAFGIEPGHERLIALRGPRLTEDGAGAGADGGAVLTALNMRGRIRVPPPAQAAG